MREFGNFHPIVNFIFFAAVIAFSMAFMHPVLLAVSLACALIYLFLLEGLRGLLGVLKLTVPLVLFTALLNPAFNHQGITVLWYFPGGNPLTLEAVVYGVWAGLMVAAVIVWFSCFNKIISSDKIIYLFGRIIPSAALVFSIILGFIPKLKASFRAICNGQKCLGKSFDSGSVFQKARVISTVFSSLTTRSLENGIETAESMKSRGYGLPGRTAYSNYKIAHRDVIMLVIIVLCSAVVVLAAAAGIIGFEFFPAVTKIGCGAEITAVYIVHFLLCALPIITELGEELKWKLLKSKI